MDAAFATQADGGLELPALLTSYVGFGAADCKQREKAKPMCHILNRRFGYALVLILHVTRAYRR